MRDFQGTRLQDAEYVATVCSVDGMHTSDLRMAKKVFPTGGFAMIASQGITYTDAQTQAGTDSFPGLLSLVTGALLTT